MLNQRQKDILYRLQKEGSFLTAQKVAKDFGVSIRTVYSDLESIQIEVESLGARLEKVPGKGYYLDNRDSLGDISLKGIGKQDFPYLDNEGRAILIAIHFLFKKNPLTIKTFSDLFAVSRGTLLTSMNNTKEYCESSGLELIGRKNSGYFLEGSVAKRFQLLERITKKVGEESLYLTLTNTESKIIDLGLQSEVTKTIRYISEQLFLTATHYYALYSEIALVLTVTHEASTKPIVSKESNSKLYRLKEYIEELTGEGLEARTLACLKHILFASTDYEGEKEEETQDDKLELAVDKLVESVQNDGTFPLTNIDSLKADITRHLKYSMEKNDSKVPEENEIVERIIATYGKEFALVKKAEQSLSKDIALNLDDNELAYLTLYFCSSFEKAQRIKDARVMVVCNSGKGASKLLATRLMNNLPEVHIVGMESAFNLEQKDLDNENIDLIVSTIRINSKHIPCIVVSPFVTENELATIRETIWYAHRQGKLGSKDERINDSEVALDQKPVKVPLFTENQSEVNAWVIMEFFELLRVLYPKGISPKEITIVSGMMAHVLMSVPRWEKQDYILGNNLKKWKKDYPQEVQYIKGFLAKVSQLLQVKINDEEAVAILRYLKY